MKKQIKNKVKLFVKKYKIEDVTYLSLKNAASEMGYTIIEFNHITNEKNVQKIIDNLNIQEITAHSKGFTYANKDYRLIFINENLNESEKVLVLSHELGHIFCSHLNSETVMGKDVREEYEANEFSHYLLNQGVWQKGHRALAKNKRKVIAVLSVLVIVALLSGATAIYEKDQLYYGNYYITETGYKYHKKECFFIKNKTNVKRLTEEQYETGKYAPCKMCLPQNDMK